MNDTQRILYLVAQQIFDLRPTAREAFWALKPEEIYDQISFCEAQITNVISNPFNNSPAIHKFQIEAGQFIYSKIEFLGGKKIRDTIALAEPDAMDQIKTLVERILR